MILVVGATGLVGGMIARNLLDRREEVRILVRPGSSHQLLVADGAEAVEGDLKDPASLVRALSGVDVVITTATAGQRSGADTPQSVDAEGNRHLIDAARAAGVRQFIFISTLLASEDSPVELPRAKGRTEAYLRGSGLPYTILASNAIMDIMLPLIVGGPVSAERPVTVIGAGRRQHSFVAPRDLAAFAAAAVRHAAALNRRIVIGGPTAFSWWDAVAAHERVLGQSIRVQSIAPGELLPDLPPVPGLTELVSGLLSALETFDSPIEMTETTRTFGVRLTSLEEFVRQHWRSTAG
jgi:NADH dehydrogenase